MRAKATTRATQTLTNIKRTLKVESMKIIKTINLSEFDEQSSHSIHDIRKVFTYFPVNGEILRIYEYKGNLYIDVLQTPEASLHKVVFELYKRDENINDATLTDYVGYVDERYIFMRK